MSKLIVFGNPNRETFANSVVAANEKSKQLFRECLSEIYVLHSNKSHQVLNANADWLEHLEKSGLSNQALIQRIIEVESAKEAIERFVRYLREIIGEVDEHSSLIVDLSNGTSVQKNLLSTAAYILDLRHQYMIDIVGLTKEVEKAGYAIDSKLGFLPAEVLIKSYAAAPDATQLDGLAHIGLTEILRYKRTIDGHSEKLAQIGEGSFDEVFFRNNLIRSIQLKLEGDRRRDNAVYRIAASAIGTSIEDLVSFLTEKFVDKNLTGANLVDKLRAINNKIEDEAPSDFDMEFLKRFNDFMRYLRNSSTHKGKLLTELEKFRAELSVKMSFPFIQFYTDVIYPILASGSQVEPPRIFKQLSISNIDSRTLYYFGLDGDNTGAILEELFVSSPDETNFRTLSKSVEGAITKICKLIKSTGKNASIVFAAGDDILFKGHFDEASLRAMQQEYSNVALGLTCSIGYGRTFQEVYLALKLAKSKPGKKAIVGLELT